MDFTHLHVHSMYSSFDGMIRIRELFQRVEELGMPGIAITDHNNMYGVAEFLSEAKRFPGIKPIVGCELCFYDKGDGRKYHLVALAKNLIGYRNLCKLSSLSCTQLYQGVSGKMLEKGRGYRGSLQRDDIPKYSEGLIVTSACIGGDIPQAILRDDMARARELVQWYKSIFVEDFYLEVSQHKSTKVGYQSSLLSKQIKANDAIFKLGEDFGVKVVASNDVHFLYKDDAAAHDVRLCISTKGKIGDENRYQFTGQEYLKSAEEMLSIFPDHPEALANTMEVYDKVEFYDVTAKPIFPRVTLPYDISSEHEYLQCLAEEAIVKYRLQGMECNEDVLRDELDLVREKNCSAYFLMLKVLVDRGRESGVMFGVGRGASPSLYLNYILGLTGLNPLEYGFLSSRCFHKESPTMFPDIDFDISQTDGKGRRSFEVLFQICQDLYGRDCVSRVKENRPIGMKELLRLVFHSLDIDDKSLKCESPKVQEGIRIAERLYGAVGNNEIVRGAILISGSALSGLMPMETFGEVVGCQYDYKYVEKMGAIKLDFLESEEIEVLRGESKGVQISGDFSDAYSDAYSNVEVFKLFSDGDTYGIAYFDTPKMKYWLMRLKPTSLRELASLYAMATMGSDNLIHLYIKRKGNPDYAAEGLAFLDDSYGVHIFQEQAMIFGLECGNSSKHMASPSTATPTPSPVPP